MIVEYTKIAIGALWFISEEYQECVCKKILSSCDNGQRNIALDKDNMAYFISSLCIVLLYLFSYRSSQMSKVLNRKFLE